MAGATDYSSAANSGASLLIEGTEGALILDDLTGKVTLWKSENPFAGSREATVYTPSQILDKIGLAENCISAVKDFAIAVYEDKPPAISGEDGLKMILMEEAIFNSNKTGKWENIG